MHHDQYRTFDMKRCTIWLYIYMKLCKYDDIVTCFPVFQHLWHLIVAMLLCSKFYESLIYLNFDM